VCLGISNIFESFVLFFFFEKKTVLSFFVEPSGFFVL